MKLKPIKVSVLNQFIKKYLMSNSILNNLRVEGEITNIRRSKSGYTYFSLCDDLSSVNCVYFYNDSTLKNGDKVIVEGELSVYEAKGTYQINVRYIERIGLGNILKDLEALKERLKSQGLFENNKKLPIYPSKIGIITSKSGAAIHDILKTFESVKGNFEVIIYNVLVQGEKSKQNIIDGINYFNDNGADVILISRGGGSFEDLNVFNDIYLAESAYKSKIPVVTGIGHETDRTLLDYVADVYCHTPTAAAEMIIRGYKDIENTLAILFLNLKTSVNNYIIIKSSELKASKYILKSSMPIGNIYKLKGELDNYKYIIKEATYNRLNNIKYQLEIINEKLQSNNYKKQLDKGFAIVTDINGRIIRNKTQVEENDMINIKLKNLDIQAKTINVREAEYDK